MSNQVHEIMRGCGVGPERKMSTKALFQIWKSENAAYTKWVTDESALELFLKGYLWKFDFPAKGEVSLVLPNALLDPRKVSIPNITLKEIKKEISELLLNSPTMSATLEHTLAFLSPRAKENIICNQTDLKNFLRLHTSTFVFLEGPSLVTFAPESGVAPLKICQATVDEYFDDPFSKLVLELVLKICQELRRECCEGGGGGGVGEVFVHVREIHKFPAVSAKFKTPEYLCQFFKRHDNFFYHVGGYVTINARSGHELIFSVSFF